MPAAKPKLKIAVSLVPHADYREGILSGVQRFADALGEWEITCVNSAGELASFPCDGVIANIQDETLEVFESLKVPVVKIGARREFAQFSSVQMDNASVGRLGACNLMMHGFAQFGFLGIMGQAYARERQLAFESQLTAFGLPTIALSIAEAEELSLESGPLVRLWVSSIKGPSAVMTGTDLLGRRLIELCGAHGIAVPEKTAVLGFNNGLIECLGAKPHLSSVPQERATLGYTAARLLNARITGEDTRLRKILVPARRIEARDSTAAFVFPDPELNALLSEAHAQMRAARERDKDAVFYSEDLRRYLARNAKGNDVRQYALRLQILLAEYLLRRSDWPIAEIAHRCGLDDLARFDGLFKLAFDTSPSDYRARFDETREFPI